NNIISLGGNTKTTIYGIYETGEAGNNNNLYFNTVYVGGDGNGGTNNSYALYSAVTTNTRNFRNNIFFNARSTTFGLDLHYAAYIVSAGGSITCDFNDYLASGTYGGTLGYYGGNKTALPIVTGQDVSSFAINPNLSSPGGTSAGNYLPSAATLVAVTGTGITTDYDGGAARSSSYPSMGAFEYTVAPGSWTWTGSTGTDWNTAANWNYNTIPSTSGNAVIADVTNDPTVNEATATPAQCQNLTINSGGVLTIAAGKALTVNGTLTNNGGTLKLNSTSSALIASLRMNSYSRGTGAAEEIQLYLTGGAGTLWHYISSPVTSLSTTIFSSVSVRSVTRYEENWITNDWNNGWVSYEGLHYNPAATPPAWEATGTPWSTLDAGRAYNYNSTSNRTFTISGAINTNDTPVTLKYASGGAGTAAYQGYNLIGNPFTSSIDWDVVRTSTLNTGQPNWSSVEQAIYFRSSGVLYTYNGVTVPGDKEGRYLAPMQGCFIKSNINNFNLYFPASAKLHSANPRFKGATIIPLVRLQIDNSGKSDQTVVRFDEKASLAFDNEFDARKLYPSSDMPSISSSLGVTDYTINGIPFPENSISIPLIFNAPVTGSYMISAKELAGLEDFKVTLTDKDLNFTINLSEVNTFSFVSSAGKFADRFILTISNSITRVPEIVTSKTEFNVFSVPGILNIQTLNETWNGLKGDIKIFDIIGRQLLIQKNIYFNAGDLIQIPVQFTVGAYIVEIKSGVKRFVGKVVIR
ncbi:MAG: hypothetical protein C0408_04385, partial [Odoribacter sp.]|nr:hypothetical protein [Odoribacter sp.]